MIEIVLPDRKTKPTILSMRKKLQFKNRAKLK